MLSLVRFIYRICIHYEVKMCKKTHMYFCNNKTAVNKIAWTQWIIMLKGIQTLLPDYDVQAHTEELIEKFKATKA